MDIHKRIRPFLRTNISATKLNPLLSIIIVCSLIWLFVPLADPSPVNAQTVIDTIKLGDGGHGPADIAINAATNRIYVANIGHGNLSVIDGSTNNILATVSIGGAGATANAVDVNPITNRIFVTHFVTQCISVIDGASNSVIATVAVGNGPSDVAVNSTTNRIYVANEHSNSISVIDGATNSVMATISVGVNPGRVAVNPNANRIYVANNGSSNVSVIDGINNTVLATVPVGVGPCSIAVNAINNRIYVGNNASNTISIIDGATNSVVETVTIAVGKRAIAVNTTVNRIYTTGLGDNVSVIDGATNLVLADIAVGHEPWGIAVNSLTNRIYVANYMNDSISVIDGTTNSVMATVVLGTSPSSVAVNSATHLIYVANSGSNSVSVIDGATNSVVATIPVGFNPHDIAVNPTTNRIYTANAGGNSISVIDGTTNSVMATVPLGSGPWGIAANPATNRIYVANFGIDSVSVIDGTTNSVVATVPVGDGPCGISVSPVTNRIYVANDWSGTVSVIDGTTNTVVATFYTFYPPHTPTLNPHGVAINATNNRIYVTNHGTNNISVVDGTNNNVLAIVSVGNAPGGIAVNPTSNRIYVANGASCTISIIDGATDAAVATIPVGLGPGGIAVNSLTNRVYVANGGDDTVSVIYDHKPSNQRPVLLVHGFQCDLKHPSLTQFNFREMWEPMAKALTGNNWNNVAKVDDPTHTWYKLNNAGENDFIVYISNYSYAEEDSKEKFIFHGPTLDDIRNYAQNLATEIEKVKEETGANKIEIVAHSMGGLVSRTYIESSDFYNLPYSYNDDVGRLITLGSPHHGSPLAIIHKYHPFITDCLACDQMKEGSDFLNILNYGRINSSGNDIINTKVNYTTIVGDYYKCSRYWSLLIADISYASNCAVFHGISNDERVSINSAKISNVSSITYPLDHTSLRITGTVCQDIRRILLSQPVFYERIHTIAFACPVQIVITDEFGRSISDTGINNIPGASVSIDEITELIVFYLPPNLSYTVYVNSYDTGEFSVMEQLPLSDKETLVNIFANIDVMDQTKITFEVVEGETSRLLKIDYDGDGTVDSERNLDVNTIISTRTYTVLAATGTGTAMLQSDGGIIENLVAVKEATLPHGGKPNMSFLHGLLSFNITDIVPGSTVAVTITYPTAVPANAQYWKYQSGRGWYQIPILSGLGTDTITIQLTDGGWGDADGLANGIIVDPGGVAIPTVPASNSAGVPTSHGSSVPGTITTPPVQLPNIQIQSASLSASRVSPGMPVMVTASVTNRGTANGSSLIKLYVNGEEESSQGITLKSGDAQSIYFTISRNQPGTYTVYVNNIQAGSFVIEDVIDPNIILIISCMLIFLSFLLGTIYFYRSRKYGY